MLGADDGKNKPKITNRSLYLKQLGKKYASHVLEIFFRNPVFAALVEDSSSAEHVLMPEDIEIKCSFSFSFTRSSDFRLIREFCKPKEFRLLTLLKMDFRCNLC